MDKDVRFAIKGERASHGGARTFHVDAFSSKEDAIDTAEAVIESGEFARVYVKDQETGSIVWEKDAA